MVFLTVWVYIGLTFREVDVQRLDGKKVSAVIREQIAEQVKKLNQPPGLGVILVGEDPASQVYVRNKFKACEAVGMKSIEVKMPASISPEDLKSAINDMNENPEVTAYLVQLPLPKGFDTKEVTSWIAPHKDADGLTVESLGLLFAGTPKAIPCTPHGVMKILEHYNIPVEGKKAVVIGRSQIVGYPMAHLLVDANATVTICHSRTQDLYSHTREADIVVVAAGKPKFIGKDAFKKGAVVVDVGIHRMDNGKLCGDVDPEDLEGHVEALTPVPGGVGPMTITMLLQNTLNLAQGKG